MLEHLGPREFEEYCQALFICLYRCPVVLTKQTGDEGRDLLVHKPGGLEVFECKHWPNGAVGRPEVQKLHSAIITANATQGGIITTGRFSNEAEVYAGKLADVKIELLDGSKLAYLISLAFPNGTLANEWSSAKQTTPDADFPTVFFQSVLSEPRFKGGASRGTTTKISRKTRYKAYFIANYQADGKVKTAVGEFSKSWRGQVWISANNEIGGFGTPGSNEPTLQRLAPLAEVLQSVPGTSTMPRLQPHQAIASMKDYIIRECVKRVWYRGRNNVSYCKIVQPSRNSIVIESPTLCYLPYQEFEIDIGGVQYKGKVEEWDSPPAFHITCPELSECRVCGKATTADNQILCSICFRPAHRWGIFSPDSFECAQCGGFVCRDDAARLGQQIVCRQCCPAGQSLCPRWWGHCLLGMAGSTGVTLASAALLLCLFLSGWALAGIVSVGVVAIGLLLGMASWLPLGCLVMQGAVSGQSNTLTYPKAQIHAKPTKQPEWLYGPKS